MTAKNIWASVTEPARGVRDGEMKVTDFGAGDVITGNLAAIAIEKGWAEQGEGEPPVEQSDEENNKVASKNINDLGARIATATNNQAEMEKLLATKNKEKSDLDKDNKDLSVVLNTVESLQKVSDAAYKKERDFSNALIDLVSSTGVMDDELGALMKKHGRSDQLDLTPKDMASKLVDKPAQGKKK